jgi:O-acetyl-ADP-ribose deacetylase (regulator of RNase III)
MTVEHRTGDILKSSADALVNPVNCVGVMGKGLALAFRKAYPHLFEEYAEMCEAGQVHIGHMHVYRTFAVEGPRFIFNFPTKDDWRNPSKLDYIEEGLDDVLRCLDELPIQSIAVPALGCGEGGLSWGHVLPLIEEAAYERPDVRWEIYRPK